MNAETRLAELLETQWVPTNKPVLFADITEAVGLESTALVVGTIKAASAQNPLMETILIAMSTVGLSLSTAERQGVIDSLAVAGSWPDAVRDAVKALGGVTRPKWVGAGYASEPTLAEVQAVIDAEVLAETARNIHAAKQVLKLRLQRIAQEITNRIDVGSILTVDEFAAVIDEVQ